MRNAGRLVSAGIFVVLGALAAGFGLHDFFWGTFFEVRIYGGAVAATGLLMLAAALGLFVNSWRLTWGTPIALLAGIVGAGLGVFLLFGQFPYRDGARAWLLVVWVAWIVASAVAIILRPKPEFVAATSRGEARTRSFWVRAIATLSSLGIGGALLSNLLLFAYNEVKASSSNNAYGLSISEQLVDHGQSGDQRFHWFAVHVSLKNPTGFEVQVLRSTYAVLGRTVSQQDSANDDDFARRLVQARLDQSFSSRYAKYAPRELLEEGEMLITPTLLQSAQEFNVDFEVALPQDQVTKYQYLRLETNFVVAKGSRLHAHVNQPRAVGACSYFGEVADQCILTEFRINSPGWLWTLSKGSHTVETVEGLVTRTKGNADQAAWIGYCVLRDNAPAPAAGAICDAGRDDILQAFFDLGFLSPVAYELPISASRQP